jgi:phosphoglycolate phosphatase-like HAD superfamily hydrolase
MRLPYQKFTAFSAIRRPRGAILRPVRPLCVFDLDHTLVRSPLDLVRLKVEIRALVEAEGLPLPEATRAWTIGQIIEAATAHRTTLGDACWGLCTTHEEEAVLHAAAEPGAHEALATLHTAGYPLAVWTNNTGPVARKALASCGLDGFFTVLVTRDEAALKPDPSGLRLLEAAFPERRIWVIGDSWVDGAAAHAGGAAFIAYGADPIELARRGVAPRTVLRDLRHLPEWLRTAAW